MRSSLALLAWVAMPLVAGQQPTATTPQVQPPASSAATPASSSSNAAATTTAAPAPARTPNWKWISTGPTMTACVTYEIQWALQDTPQPPASYGVNMYAYNAGVDQTVPPASSAVANPPANSPAQTQSSTAAAQTPSSSAAAAPAPSKPVTAAVGPAAAVTPPTKRWQAAELHRLEARSELHRLQPRAVINSTIVEGQPANVAYRWVVNVPAGRYRLLAVVNQTNTFGVSDPFTVLDNKDNTSCIDLGKTQVTSSVVSSTSSGSSSVADATATGDDTGSASGGLAGNETKKKGIGGGAIAGIVIGVLAGIAIAALLLFCCMKRRRRSAASRGGREEKDGKSFIGSPANFRKGSRNGGHALSALGMRNGERDHTGADALDSGTSSEDPAEKHRYLTSEMAQGPVMTRQMSAVSNATSDNPFETAPSTPVEEKHAPELSAPAIAAAAAYRGTDRDAPRRLPPVSSLPADSHRPYAGIAEPEASSHHDHGSPAGPLTPTTAAFGSNPGTPAHAAHQRQSGAFSSTMSHQTSPSNGSVLDSVQSHGAAGTTPSVVSHGPSSHAPSSFNTPSRGGPAERKTSLRRKPVPQLAAGTGLPLSDHGHGEHTVTPPATSEAGHEVASQLPPSSSIATGPAGDEFGLNAALAGIGRGQTFNLMPDPPMEQKEAESRFKNRI